MNRGIISSFSLHTILLLLMVLGVPEMLRKDLPPVPPVMVVEILPVTGKTNVRPSEPKQKVDADQKKPDKKEEPKPKEQQKPEEKKPDPKPVPEVKKEEVKKEEPKKEGIKKEEPKKEEKEKPKPKDDFAEILKNVAKSSNQKQGADDTNPNKAINTEFNEAEPMSMAEVDYIRQKVKTCWNVGTFAGMKDSRKMVVNLRINLLADGTVMDVKPEDFGRMNDPLYRVAAETAMRAVRKCSPFDRLPPEKYENWKEMTMSFDPSEMLY